MLLFSCSLDSNYPIYPKASTNTQQKRPSNTTAPWLQPQPSNSANEPAPTHPFHFFDLPAGLRLKIYENLLTLQPSRTHPSQISRHSQILRASKSCHNEAQPILEHLNTLQLKMSTFALRDGSPRDYTLPSILLKFPGGVEDSFWHVFEDLPLSEGTCYDVHQRWQRALQSGGGGGRLRVWLELSYHSITCAGAERLAASIAELQGQGIPHDSVCDAVLEGFLTSTKSVAAGCMSIAEVLQLAFALEHLVPSLSHLPMLFISGRSGEYDRLMNRNHAHELMTMSTKPDAQFVGRLWALIEWMPASVANITTRMLLGHHACRWDFRRDLRLVEKNMLHLKAPERLRRGYNLPYTKPPVVWGLLPWVQSFLEHGRKQHSREGASVAVKKVMN